MSTSTIHEHQLAPHKRRRNRFRVSRGYDCYYILDYKNLANDNYVAKVLGRRMAEVIRDALNERYDND